VAKNHETAGDTVSTKQWYLLGKPDVENHFFKTS
jgi:hypothetical protein